MGPTVQTQIDDLSFFMPFAWKQDSNGPIKIRPPLSLSLSSLFLSLSRKRKNTRSLLCTRFSLNSKFLPCTTDSLHSRYPKFLNLIKFYSFIYLFSLVLFGFVFIVLFVPDTGGFSFSSFKVSSFVLNFIAFCISKHCVSHWVVKFSFLCYYFGFLYWIGFFVMSIYLFHCPGGFGSRVEGFWSEGVMSFMWNYCYVGLVFVSMLNLESLFGVGKYSGAAGAIVVLFQKLHKGKPKARLGLMGASSSKMDDDKALQLCRERKKFVRQALDGRCSLAAAHVSYVQSLKSTGTALRKFTEPEAPIESSLYTSTNATPEPLEKTLSQFSFSSPSVSQRIDPAETFSPTPSPPISSKFQANHMKFSSSSSKKVEEKPPVPIIGTVTSSGTPQNATPRSAERSETSAFDDSSLPVGTPPWDFFGLFHPIDHQFSFQEGKVMHQDMGNPDDMTRLREEEGIPELEDDEEKVSSHGREESQDSEDEFGDEPATDTLVRRFENFNRVNDHVQANGLPATNKPLIGDSTSEVEFVNGEKGSSPDVSPLKTASTAVVLPMDTNKPTDKENHSENKVVPKDFFSSMKDIELLFVKASESGKEVPRMLEANKLHFRPMFPAKENGSVASSFLKACFSCGEDPTQLPEEPAQNSVKYLTWHRTMSSGSSSSRNPLGANSKDDKENLTNNLFDNFCMISGSHASTLDRLYAWERKLYDEVKASGAIRKDYDMKCKILQHLESKEVKSSTIDKTRAVVKDLHSRIRVAILRIDSISKRIEELRDKELQPQLEELIEGLSRMWEVMFDCHKLQFQIMSTAYSNSHARITMHSELRRQIASYLESELHYLSSSFTKWIGAQKSYLEAINGWLYKCVKLQQKTAKKKRRPQPPLLRIYGPPIYATCDIWLEKIGELPIQDVVDSIKNLAGETVRFLPRQEKNQGKGANHPHITSWNARIGGESSDNLLRDDTAEDWDSGFDRFRSSFLRFLGQLNSFSGSSVKMYTELRQAIQNSKNYYHHRSNYQAQDGQWNSQSQDDNFKAQSQAANSEMKSSKQ
ncbi:hypothetical protein VNO77_44709 [Canavalia gladiata]|uniref:Uncharacterized protein n=1 Tax=Canavalia gladiata TaxID=3824 RepID=A0AAN9PRA1_CANGL